MNKTDAVYAERNRLVAALGKMAPRNGGRCWLGQHESSDTSWEPEWRNIIYIDLPEAGQMSWHIHDSDLPLFSDWIGHSSTEWDGHSTEEKYARLEKIKPANNRVITCVYCGYHYPTDAPASHDQRLKNHIAICEEHPIGHILRACNAAKKVGRDYLSIDLIHNLIEDKS